MSSVPILVETYPRQNLECFWDAAHLIRKSCFVELKSVPDFGNIDIDIDDVDFDSESESDLCMVPITMYARLSGLEDKEQGKE